MMDDCQNPKHRECHHMMRIKKTVRAESNNEVYHICMCEKCEHVTHWRIKKDPLMRMGEILRRFFVTLPLKSKLDRSTYV